MVFSGIPTRMPRTETTSMKQSAVFGTKRYAMHVPPSATGRTEKKNWLKLVTKSDIKESEAWHEEHRVQGDTE